MDVDQEKPPMTCTAPTELGAEFSETAPVILFRCSAIVVSGLQPWPGLQGGGTGDGQGERRGAVGEEVSEGRRWVGRRESLSGGSPFLEGISFWRESLSSPPSCSGCAVSVKIHASSLLVVWLSFGGRSAPSAGCTGAGRGDGEEKG